VSIAQGQNSISAPERFDRIPSIQPFAPAGLPHPSEKDRGRRDHRGCARDDAGQAADGAGDRPTRPSTTRCLSTIVAAYIAGVIPSLPTLTRIAVSLSPTRVAVMKTFAPGRMAD
jgi:hypothetical protein